MGKILEGCLKFLQMGWQMFHWWHLVIIAILYFCFSKKIKMFVKTIWAKVKRNFLQIIWYILLISGIIICIFASYFPYLNGSNKVKNIYSILDVWNGVAIFLTGALTAIYYFNIFLSGKDESAWLNLEEAGKSNLYLVLAFVIILFLSYFWVRNHFKYETIDYMYNWVAHVLWLTALIYYLGDKSIQNKLKAKLNSHGHYNNSSDASNVFAAHKRLVKKMKTITRKEPLPTEIQNLMDDVRKTITDVELNKEIKALLHNEKLIKEIKDITEHNKKSQKIKANLDEISRLIKYVDLPILVCLTLLIAASDINILNQSIYTTIKTSNGSIFIDFNECFVAGATAMQVILGNIIIGLSLGTQSEI